MNFEIKKNLSYMFLGSIITIILFELFFETPYKRLKYEIKNS